MTIEVVAYDASWPVQFETVRRALAVALDGVPLVAIEHVGSTSVPGLAAKPVIDIDVVVDRSHVSAAIAALEGAGYRRRGDLGIADRHSMAEADEPRRNVYVVVAGSLALRNHLAVRDALRSDPELRERYAGLKAGLAADWPDVDRYVAGKTDLLVSLLAAAGFTEPELDAIRAANQPR